MTTIYDVARAAAVSIATVSRVVNDKPGVAEATKQRVKQVIEALNWRPNVLAQSLAKR